MQMSPLTYCCEHPDQSRFQMNVPAGVLMNLGTDAIQQK